jgi:hypothetical protein
MHTTSKSWSVEQVAQWLESIGLGEVIKNFKGKSCSIFFQKK